MANMDPQRILITGAAGFVGTKLARTLRLGMPNARLILCDHAEAETEAGRVVAADVTDTAAIQRLIRYANPTAVVHLAARSFVGASYEEPRSTWRVNLGGTLEIVLAIQAHAPNCHLIYISSAEVYGLSALGGEPTREDAQLLPINPYAASKAAADILVQESAWRGLHATIVRPFNHTGPGQSVKFVVPAFCSQIARIEAGLQEPIIKVGDLNDERDFLDVADVVDLYSRILEKGAPRQHQAMVVNAASGRSRRIGSILETLLGMSSQSIRVEIDQGRLRPSPSARMVGEPKLAKRTYDWSAAKNFNETLGQTLAYWRERVAAEVASA